MNKVEPSEFFNACVKGDIKTVETFIAQGFYPIDIKNENNWTGLIMACFNENIDLAKMLINNGASVNATNDKGTTVFMYAKTPIQKKQTDTGFLKYLIDKGANINSLDQHGHSVLDYVSENSYDVLADWMKDNGAKHSAEMKLA